MRITRRRNTFLLVLAFAAPAFAAASCDADDPATVNGSLPDGGNVSGDASAGEGGRDADVPTIAPVHVEHACGEGHSLRVSVLEDRVVRFHHLRGAEAPDRGWLYDLGKMKGPTAAKVTGTPSKLAVKTGALDIEVAGPTCAVVIRETASGATLWQEAAPFAADAQGNLSLAKKLDTGEHVFGLGEKTGAAERRGRTFEMWNSDPAWSDPLGRYRNVTDPIYQSHPFFVSMSGGRATGTFLANTHKTRFDVGKTAPDALAMSAAGGDLDFFFFDGPNPSEVVERYTRLLGRAPMPPAWALGYHQSRWSYTPASRVEQVAFEFRRRGLPIDGMWLDIDYMAGFRDFTWNPTTFADHKGLLARLAGNGFKVTTILDPGVKSEPGSGYAAYDDGVAKSVFILGEDGKPITRDCWPGAAVFPDFSDPKARAWWGDKVGGLLEAGVRGTWIDMNEPAVFVKEGFPLDANVHGEGKATKFGELKNVYALLMARATYEGQLKAFPDRRPFILTRAGFAGIQKYSAVWTGDAESTWDHLAMAPAMLQGMGVSGIPFVGSDIGGFTGSPSPELYGRWFEVGALSPFFRSHVATGTPDQEPWSFGPEIEDLAKRMLQLRYTLMPYWYSTYEEAHRTGAPLVRPLWFEAPKDEQAYAHEDEVFIGGALLAAPVLAPGINERDVYLPAGSVFYDFWSGAAYEGGRSVKMPAPLGRIPLFAKGGSVVAMGDAVDYVGAAGSGRLYLHVFPGAPGTQSSTSLYEDDGDTLGYTRGASATTRVDLAVTAQGATIKTSAPSGGFSSAIKTHVVRVHGIAKATSSVVVDGATVSAKWDVATRSIDVTVPPGAHTIVVAYDASTMPPPRTTGIDLTVTLPAGTPAGDIFVGSSALGWLPSGAKLTRTGNTATGRMTVPEGALVKLKITRGTWPTVEVGAGCESLPNRIVSANWAPEGTGATAVSLSVSRWQDQCQ